MPPAVAEKEYTLPTSRCEARIANHGSNVAVIVTHPWGPLGGNLHNNVVVAATLYFQRLGITTARFNFNGGIGRGHTQVQQVLELAKGLLEGQYGGKAKSILLVGYSYGSLIAGSASADLEECIGSVSIAPPFSVSHWLLMFNSAHHLAQMTKRENFPRLLLLGTEDNFTSEYTFQSTIDTSFPIESSTGAIINGADHFFRRREKDVMDVIGQWILENFPQCNGDLLKFKDIAS